MKKPIRFRQPDDAPTFVCPDRVEDAQESPDELRRVETELASAPDRKARFLELAKGRGVHLDPADLERALRSPAGALDERTLDAVSGGGNGDDQLANVDLQSILQKQQQTLQMMSNIGKMLYDTAMAVIRKRGG